MRWISEPEFAATLRDQLQHLDQRICSVTGPGRSGAIAAVYASHILGVPFIPEGCVSGREPWPILVIDTARASGKTLRKAARRAEQWVAEPRHCDYSVIVHAVYEEPPRVGFWYEAKAPAEFYRLRREIIRLTGAADVTPAKLQR